VGPRAAAPLITSEDGAPRLVRDEIDRWHAADTGGDAGKEADFVVVDPADMPPLHAAVAPVMLTCGPIQLRLPHERSP